MTADPEIPVPPSQYGGIERIVDLLTSALALRGHSVHLCANASSANGYLRCKLPGATSHGVLDTIKNTVAISNHYRKYGPFDLVHSFGRMAYTVPFLLSGTPVLQSYQRAVTASRTKRAIAAARGPLAFSACSRSCASTGQSGGGSWHVIYNGVELKRYPFQATVPPDGPLVFLGRIEPIKGAHHAIKAALTADRTLIIAGNHHNSGPQHEYFRKEILPFCDGQRVQFVGPVDDTQKATLLGSAAALLFPIQWEEPFGIVMTEALACGTPVIAFRRGAVPEVVEHRKTGFLCDNVGEMVSAIEALHTIDRSNCRQAVESRFSSEVITTQYEDLYRKLLAV